MIRAGSMHAARTAIRRPYREEGVARTQLSVRRHVYRCGLQPPSLLRTTIAPSFPPYPSPYPCSTRLRAAKARHRAGSSLFAHIGTVGMSREDLISERSCSRLNAELAQLLLESLHAIGHDGGNLFLLAQHSEPHRSILLRGTPSRELLEELSDEGET